MPVVLPLSGVDWRCLLVDSAGSPLAVGGGTQYVDGVTQATPTGNVVEWLDAANVIRAASATKPLPVNVISGGGGSQVDASAWTTAVTSFAPGGGVFNDSAAALTSGQQGTQRLTAQRAAHANLRTTAGVDVLLTNNGAAPAALTNLGTLGALANAAAPSWTEGRQVLHSVDLAGNLRTLDATLPGRFPVAAATADGLVNPTVTQIETLPMVWNGTTWDRWKDFAAASNLGSFAGVPAVGMVVLDTVDAQLKRTNSVASAIAGGVTGKNAMAVGAMRYTVAHGVAPTNYAAGVFAAPLMTKAGVPFVATGHPANISQSINYTGAQTNTVVIANTAGTKLVISSILVQASAANTVNIAVGVGLAQTVTPASATAGRLGGSAALAAGGGFGRKTYQAGADGDQLLVTSTGAGDFTCTVEYHLTTTA